MSSNGCRGFILVVEDDVAACASLVSGLVDEGYSASGVKSIANAKLILSRVLPDVLVLDLGLQDGDGAVLLDQLRSSREARVADTPVIVVSGKANARQLAPGADAVFSKPMRLTDLLCAIAEVKERRARAVGA
jgi:DNA-binding response OmpR family regulator